MTAPSLDTVVDNYIAAWNEPIWVVRQQLLEASLSADAHYLDPMTDVHGYDGLHAAITGLQAQLPAHRLLLVGPIDMHHDRARWDWSLVRPDGTTRASAGVDFAVLAPDGRLREVIGFFDPPSA